MSTSLLLVRHGETPFNRDGRVQGWLDPPLNETGTEQARRIATRLQPEPISAIYTSDLQRARHTAELIGQALNQPAKADSRLREHHLGEIQGLTNEEIRAKFPERTRQWNNSIWRVPAPDEEPMETLATRVRACCDELIVQHPAQTIVIVSHGGALNVLLMSWLGIDLRRRPMFHLYNSSLSKVSVDGEMVRVHYVNDVQHLHGLSF